MDTKNNKIPPYKLFFSIIYVFIYPILLLFISGDKYWIEGWIFSIWFLSSTIITLLYLYFNDPELLAERYVIHGRQNQKNWDKYFLAAMIILYIVWFVIMPLDAKRFGWSANFPILLKVVGGIGVILSSIIMFKSLADNTFTSPMVRIQTERNQHVVSTGVYGIVRHPMYLGAILMFLGLPVMLGSMYGVFIGMLLSFIFILRIFGEEKMLETELDGYKEYKQKVKYRLIPFVW